MERLVNVLFVVLTVLVTLTHQQNKVPPGVNPSQYQQQPPQQQQYQPPPPPPPQQVQYQQQPIQSAIPQEVPIQHVQHQPPPPPPQPSAHQGHGQGHGHHGQPQILNAANLAEEKEHMQEHLNVNIDTSKMTEQELQFHYFKMHDADNNNKLDGCELIKSLIHWHEQGHHDPSGAHTQQPQEKIFADEELTNLIDPILNMDDVNGDGYIDYPEFVRAQQKAAAAAQANKPPPHA